MLDTRLAFDSPWYLGLLALLPVLLWSGYRTLSGLGRMRRLLALLLRSAVLVLIVLALAEIQKVRISDRLTVIYLLDQSLSVPEDQRQKAIRYINASIKQHRDANRGDRAGVIVFGRDAAVEIPPFDDDVALPRRVESLLDPEYTNLAGAMKMALALFPHDAAKRIVVISDGNENVGDALSQSRELIEAGVGIDVLPILIQARGEVAVEKLAVSSDVRRGQPFDLRVVLNHTPGPNAPPDHTVTGKLRITRRAGEREEVLAEETVSLPPGKRVLTVRQQVDEPDFYTYQARFVPDNPEDDTMPQNNQASTFTHVRGRGHVLLIEDWAAKGEFDYLVQRLRAENLEVSVQTSDQLFTSLSELQRYDTVVLANVPRSSGDESDEVTNFSDEQVAMLVRNTQQMGSGLVMLGGPNSFGAGGWSNTELEEAMPVDFHIKSAKVVPVGALAMIMHASEMAQGNHWQKVIAREAIKALGGQDYCGVAHWDGTDKWLWGQPQGMIKVGPNRQRMLARIDRMIPGDMPQFDPAMILAANGFAALPDAAVKHMIIISDGDPSPPSTATLRRLQQLQVKVSTVAVGTHGPPLTTPLERIATATGGKYYEVNNPRALPRIYQREARRVARPLVYENPQGMAPQIKFSHEMIQGLDEHIPPITGFVLTTVKDSPLVEVSLVSPQPAGEENATLLASWTYGLGKAVALTTDAGHRWASSWTPWDNYDKLFSQVIRWSMRPVADSGKFTVAADVSEGKGRLVITALDQDDEFLNFLDMTGTVVGPDMKPIELKLRQTAPGRYLGEFESDKPGSYFALVNPGAGRAPLRTGINVPYSDEFRDVESNTPLLEAIAALAPKNGQPGQVIDAPRGGGQLEALLAINPFRAGDLPPATSSQDIWHLLALAAACLFFFDVFNRRVSLSFAWAMPLVNRALDKVLRRETVEVENVTMDRLRSRKAAIDDQLEQKRASVRFQPNPEETAAASVAELLEDDSARPTTTTSAKPEKSLSPAQKEESYTERLLKAKKQVWQDRSK